MTQPLQVYFEEADLRRLAAWSQGHGLTKSEAVRAAVRALIRPRDDDPLLSLSGFMLGLPADASGRFDHYLAETFVDQTTPRRRGRRRPRPAARIRR